MEKGWVLIYSSGKIHDVELIKGMLSEHDIKTVQINKQDAAYLIGEIEVYVKHNDVIKAKYLIDKNRP